MFDIFFQLKNIQPLASVCVRPQNKFWLKNGDFPFQLLFLFVLKMYELNKMYAMKYLEILIFFSKSITQKENMHISNHWIQYQSHTNVNKEYFFLSMNYWFFFQFKKKKYLKCNPSLNLTKGFFFWDFFKFHLRCYKVSIKMWRAEIRWICISHFLKWADFMQNHIHIIKANSWKRNEGKDTYF